VLVATFVVAEIILVGVLMSRPCVVAGGGDQHDRVPERRGAELRKVSKSIAGKGRAIFPRAT
jgi:hypothetical protein